MSQWVYYIESSTSRFIIYGLFDPRTDELRYVGKSTSGLKRPRNHTKTSDLKRHGRTHKTAWVKSLLSVGLKPVVKVLWECSTAEVLYDEEQRQIAHYRRLGFRLTNATDGGPGRVGYRLSEETKDKIRRSAIEQQMTNPTDHGPEVRGRLRLLQLGRVHSLEHRSNMSRAHGGRPFIDTSTGRRYETQTQAANDLGLQQVKIGMVLRGKRRTTGGRTFRFID